jgi:D-threo-aldose 1-dehydrogenase
MRTSRLGRSEVEVTQLGFGGGPLGGLFAPLDDNIAAAALAAAWDAGIRYFDTSPRYGIGVSERRTGELLRQKPRAEFTLSTKVGRLLVPQDPAGRADESFQVPATHRRVWDFSREGVLRSVDDSLARLGAGRVDVLFPHDAEDHFEAALRDGYPALAELRAQGAVGAIGAGMYHTGMLTRLVQETDVDVVMLSASAGGHGLPAAPSRGGRHRGRHPLRGGGPAQRRGVRGPHPGAGVGRPAR